MNSVLCKMLAKNKINVKIINLIYEYYLREVPRIVFKTSCKLQVNLTYGTFDLISILKS